MSTGRVSRNPPPARKRNRKRKRRAASSSSSSSSDSSSEESTHDAVFKISKPKATTKVKFAEPASSSESSSSASSSSSDESENDGDGDGDGDVTMNTGESSAKVDAEAQKPVRRRRTPSPSPPPAPIQSFLPPAGADDAEEAEKKLKDRFRKFWMASIADGFRDDLEQIRKEPSMTSSRLALLIDSLATGADAFTSHQSGNGTADVSEMTIILGETR